MKGRDLPYSDHRPGTPEHSEEIHNFILRANPFHYVEKDRVSVGAPSIGRKLVNTLPSSEKPQGLIIWNGCVFIIQEDIDLIMKVLTDAWQILENMFNDIEKVFNDFQSSISVSEQKTSNRKQSKERLDRFRAEQRQREWKRK